RQLAGADVARVHLAARADEPLRDLLLRHLEAEEGARRLLLIGDVFRDLERDRALPQRRTGGDDHEVRGLETAGELVEILEAAREPGHLGTGLVEADARLHSLHSAR